MLFCMKNALATLKRMNNPLICDLKASDGYIDDMIVHSDTFEEHMLYQFPFHFLILGHTE